MKARRIIVHMYDYERTALEGCRVLCGRYTHNVSWIAGYTGKNPVTCKPCRKAMKQRNYKSETSS